MLAKLTPNIATIQTNKGSADFITNEGTYLPNKAIQTKYLKNQ